MPVHTSVVLPQQFPFCLTEKELTLKVVQDRPQCVANDTIASPEADAQISPLRDGESRAPASVAWENARGIRPPGGDGSEAFNHQGTRSDPGSSICVIAPILQDRYITKSCLTGQAIGVDANVVGKNISLQRSHDNHSASKAMPPPTSKYDGRANSIGCTSSPKERKRPRYSPGMVASHCCLWLCFYLFSLVSWRFASKSASPKFLL